MSPANVINLVRPSADNSACYRPHKREAQHALRPPGFTFVEVDMDRAGFSFRWLDPFNAGRIGGVKACQEIPHAIGGTVAVRPAPLRGCVTFMLTPSLVTAPRRSVCNPCNQTGRNGLGVRLEQALPL